MSDEHIRTVQLYRLGLSDLGGVAASFRAWTEGLAQAGGDVVGVTAGGRRPSGTKARWIDIRFRGRGSLAAPIGLGQVLRRGDVLVLHSAWSGANVAAARVARRAGVPYITVPHGAYDPRVVARRRAAKTAWATALERPMLRNALAVHVFFEGETEHLRALGYEGDTIVAPNGVEVPPVDGRDPDGYVLWWGRLDVEHKGLDLLLAAMALVPESPLVMHGVGSDAERERVRSLIQRAGLGDRVSLRAPVSGSDKWRALAGARVFVYPSRWDAHSIAVMEAAAAGIPVVVTDSTFVGRELADGGAAIAVPPEASAIADGIRRASSQDGDGIASIARVLARSNYAPDVVASRFLARVRELL